jgi:hypothetical protein
MEVRDAFDTGLVAPRIVLQQPAACSLRRRLVRFRRLWYRISGKQRKRHRMRGKKVRHGLVTEPSPDSGMRYSRFVRTAKRTRSRYPVAQHAHRVGCVD